MASAERIRLIQCPGCRERVIAPPPDSIGVWECPFCRRRYRRRIKSSASSGTIPCVNLFSKHPWPLGGWASDRERSIFHPARWPSLGLALYAGSLLVLMVMYHLCMTVLASAWLLLRFPVILWDAVATDEEAEPDEPRGSPWFDPLRTWVPHFHNTDPELSIGPLLTESAAPGVFVIVAEMASRVGSTVPDEIRLTHLPCCGVLEQRGWGGLRARRRVLVLGLPLLHVLSIEELRAVVAHELSHLSRGDAALAFIVSQFLDSLDQSIETGSSQRFGWLNPCVLFAWLVRGGFRVLSCPLSRYQEYRADGLAASVCGGDVVAGSLQNAALVQPIFREVLCHYHPVVIHDQNLYQFFRTAWATLDESLKEEMKESLVCDERGELFGPHPTLRARLRKLDGYLPHRDPDRRPARRLLVERRQLEESLHDHIYRVRSPRLSVFHPTGE
jgi:Zn-dependent protease with chaperone function